VTTLRGLAALGVLLAAIAARAATPEPAGVEARAQVVVPVGVHLSWVRGDGAAGCPDAGFIQAQVAARLGDDPFQRPPTQFIEALVTRPAQTLLVAIAMRGADGALLGSRTLTSAADDCRSVANAAALTIAILIDPDALLRAPPAPTSTLPTVAAPVPPPAAFTSPAASGPAGRVAIGAVGTWGLLPRAALGAALSATADLGRWAAVGVTGAFLPERRTAAPSDGFAFGLSTGEADGCFVPFGGGAGGGGRAGLRGELCAGLSAGILHAVVTSATPVGPGERWTFAATQLMRLVIPLPLPLPSPFSRAGVLEAGVGLAEPFPRRAFFVEGQPAGMDTVFTQAALAATGFVGLGLRWR
jgi:hypothetical protein